MSAAEVIREVEQAGGAVILDGELLRCRIPEQVAWLREEIRRRREEIVALLQGAALIPIACTCSKHRFPHIHSDADRRATVRQWNDVCSPTWRIQ